MKTNQIITFVIEVACVEQLISNPWVQGVLSGLIANGLTTIIAHTSQGAIRLARNRRPTRDTITKDSELATILQRAVESVAEAISGDDGRREQRLRDFLTSPEVEAIVRQVYASKLATDDDGSLQSVREEFLLSLSLHLDEQVPDIHEWTDALFDVLLEGCDRALTVSMDKGVLSAHEAKSVYRYRVLYDELTAIRENLDFLTKGAKPDVQAILQFEARYREEVGHRHSYITPPQFDAAQRIPIDSLFVSPDFIRASRSDSEEEAKYRISYPDFISTVYRAVVLGNPGSGKTTFTQKFCHDLASRYSNRLVAGRQVTPILVVLREYAAQKKEHNYSILQFVGTKATSTYQLEHPTDAFKYLLLNGRALVIFDGLDELLDTAYRQEIRSDIESFCRLYPSVPVLVTSREVGYEQAPLDQSMFETFYLVDLSEQGVTEYATKWFSLDNDLTSEQQKEMSAAFLEESTIAPDLRSNPLMLALMCNLYRGEGYIPRNRPEVYEKCTIMLFERWDKSRGIHVSVPFEAHIRPTMMHLAHWIYSDEALQGGVTEVSLISKAADYLCQWRYEDRDEAEKAACEFIEFCRGRAWVFTDTGTMVEGEILYQFTHRTFLEYFTAAYLVRVHPTPAKLQGELKPRIARREWDVVAQLSFQIQSKNVEGAGDELLTSLIPQSIGTEEDQDWHLLSFAVRCLEFIVPSPKVTRSITNACVRWSLAWGVRNISHFPPSRASHRLGAPHLLLGSLINAADDNRATVSDSLENLLIDRINSDDENETLVALEIATHLKDFGLVGGITIHAQHESIQQYWGSISERIVSTCSDRKNALLPKSYTLCVDDFFKGTLPLASLTQWHGIEKIFYHIPYPMCSGLRFGIAHSYLVSILMTNESLWPTQTIADGLGELGQVFLSCPPPWLKTRPAPSPFPVVSIRWAFHEDEHLNMRNKEHQNLPALDSKAFFGAFCLIASLLEYEVYTEDTDTHSIYIKALKETSTPFFNCLRWVFVARFEQGETDIVQLELHNCGFNPEQQTLVWQWVRGEIDFAQPQSRRQTVDRNDEGEDETEYYGWVRVLID